MSALDAVRRIIFSWLEPPFRPQSDELVEMIAFLEDVILPMLKRALGDEE